ncbi:MAG: DNA alkylation repair protein [Bacteroidota bacterium]
MSRQLGRDIVRFLEANPEYRSWENLPEGFLIRNARLSPDESLKVALWLWNRGGHRVMWAAATLIQRHPRAFRHLNWKMLEEMGDRMDHWGTVDIFSFLAGKAWRSGQISDARVHRWARSDNRWWRRAALVCTVLLNRRTLGGEGDTRRTLAVCELLVADRDDMVVKGMSWALRELIATDRKAVERFLKKHDTDLAARVRREVRNKLSTGLKNPRGR